MLTTGLVQGEVYKNNQFVFVKGEGTPPDKDDTGGRPKDFWVARILQVRAKNAQHVYALVRYSAFSQLRITDCEDYVDVLGRRNSPSCYESRGPGQQRFGTENLPWKPRVDRIELHGGTGRPFICR